MSGKFLLFLTIVSLLSSTAFAYIHQEQGFSIDAFNKASRCGCVGSAVGQNSVNVGHTQKAYEAWRGTAAFQKETATLTQSASTVGSGGSQAVMQRASADGVQDQFVRSGIYGKRAGEQSLSVGLDTSISHVGAVGRTTGTQSFVGAQNQRETTSYGVSTGSQYISATQSASVSGGPSSVVKVNNGLDATLTQSSTVTGGR
jgi:hypothetical protein